MLRDKYKQFVQVHSQAPAEERIPKVIHQIWIGGPVPPNLTILMQGWREMAEKLGWQYKLWDNLSVAALAMTKRHLFNKAPNFGEKADIVRMEVLFEEGGLYVDADFECVSPEFFAFLHEHIDMYACIEPLEHARLMKSPYEFMIGNAIIGAKPHHPLIKNYLDQLEDSYVQYPQNSCKITLWKTGPIYFTKLISEYFWQNTESADVIFPPTYFYPISAREARRNEYVVFPETAGVHYWKGSWFTPRKKTE